ncbi:hypothetical protein QQ045_005650 [Rhodiola kirilowii]
MDDKHMKLSIFLVIVSMFGLAVDNSEGFSLWGHAEGSVKNYRYCFGKCFVKCSFLLRPPQFCATGCAPKCMRFSYLINALNDETQQCNIGCAATKCTTINTKDVQGIENCAQGCLTGCVI